VVIALDRYTDFFSDKSNIIVRETSSQIITSILADQDVGSLVPFLDLFKLFLRSGFWEVRQSTLFLVLELLKRK